MTMLPVMRPGSASYRPLPQSVADHRHTCAALNLVVAEQPSEGGLDAEDAQHAGRAVRKEELLAMPAFCVEFRLPSEVLHRIS